MWEGCYSFPRIAPLYPWSLPYNAVLNKAASSTIFLVFGMTQPGIEPWSPRPLANTLLIRPMVWLDKLETKLGSTYTARLKKGIDFNPQIRTLICKGFFRLKRLTCTRKFRVVICWYTVTWLQVTNNKVKK